jgi:hypothetical protein
MILWLHFSVIRQMTRGSDKAAIPIIRGKVIKADRRISLL